jgi:hypothetical protein
MSTGKRQAYGMAYGGCPSVRDARMCEIRAYEIAYGRYTPMRWLFIKIAADCRLTSCIFDLQLGTRSVGWVAKMPASAKCLSNVPAPSHPGSH